MYSPKISEVLIPKLYWLAKAKQIRMTRLVDAMIRAALAAEDARPVPASSAVPESIPEPTKVAA